MKQKLERPALARDLYVSPLFLKRRMYVERSCDQWFILSALHGLVDPDELLEPYNRTLKEVGSEERRRWSRSVLAALEVELGDFDGRVFEVHAGAEYRNFGIVQGLEQRGAAVENPTEGLGIGRQLRFYAHEARQ